MIVENLPVKCLVFEVVSFKYHNDPKFLDRQACANSVDPDLTAA